MAQYQIRPAQIGPSLAKFFGVPYEAFNSGRIRSEMLHGPLKRDFLVEQGWIPLEESPGRSGGDVRGPGGCAWLTHRAAGVLAPIPICLPGHYANRV